MEFKIKHITREDLDVVKYDTCIKNAINSRIYAYSWYLDAVSDQWSVLVFGDYTAVMPNPKLKLKRNLWFLKIYMPPFVQQLGIFSVINLDKELINAFIKNGLAILPKIYHFNSEFIDLDNFKFNTLPNFELNLNQNYKTIFDGYNSNLKRKLKKTNPDAAINVIHDKSAIFNFIFEHAKPKLNSRIQLKFSNLYDILVKKNKVETVGFYNKNELLAVAVFLLDQGRIVNLFPISNEKGKSQNAMAFLLDVMIQKNAEKEMVFDFEGSSIEGIAAFFKSFGAVDRLYFQYKSKSFFY